jgi:hypothetical protein
LLRSPWKPPNQREKVLEGIARALRATCSRLRTTKTS